MSWVEPIHYVVIDDVCRFALHFWSYLAAAPGFGIGDVPSRDDNADFFWERPLPKGRQAVGEFDRGQPKGLTTPDGRWTVWWVDARGDELWRNQLTAVLDAIHRRPRDTGGNASKRLTERRIGFLVDVRGPSREVEAREYRSCAVCKFVKEKHPDAPVILVSSYRRLTSGRLPTHTSEVVHEKSATTFEMMKRSATWQPAKSEGPPEEAIQRHPPSRTPAESEAALPLHILVTGAGFDRGGKVPVRGLGSPSTTQLLNEALSRLDEDLWDPESKDAKGVDPTLSFPVPSRLFRRDDENVPPMGVDHRDWRSFIRAAEKGDLDSYWEYFLRLELERHGAPQHARVFDKIAAATREQLLREEFQGALALHDWGLTRQVIDAVTEDRFEVWLTTNYTRFPNRALDILGIARDRGGGAHRPWRVLSTSNEATVHLRRLLHEDAIPGARPADGSTRHAANADGPKPTNRYLFKLHGDIPHVTTMALAASDKEVYSPLSMPIDSLHWLYTTAKKHLEALIQTEGRDVVWHIVGHGLKDRLLVDLLVRTFRATGRHHDFVIVGWNPSKLKDFEDPASILRNALGNSKGWNITCLEAEARDYMARLKADRLLDRDISGRFNAWADHHGFCVRRSIGPDGAATGKGEPSDV